MGARQLVVLSGKGGTGKTSISAALAHLGASANGRYEQVFVDADVDAANLSLVLNPKIDQPNAFMGGGQALIDADLCIGCGMCATVCRYDALFPDPKNDLVYWVDPIACDGCAACVYACPQGAISMVPQQEGVWFESQTRWGKLFHAELFPGRENSGKLVTLLRQKAKLAVAGLHAPVIIIDGPPGIGCPVISACSGADMGLIVSEPGRMGLHDLERVLGVMQHFKIPTLLCINKADISPQSTQAIRDFAEAQGVEVVGEIPFDMHVPLAMVKAEPVTASFPECDAARAISLVWQKVMERLLG